MTLTAVLLLLHRRAAASLLPTLSRTAALLAAAVTRSTSSSSSTTASRSRASLSLLTVVPSYSRIAAGQRLPLHRRLLRSLPMSTVASDQSSERIRAQTTSNATTTATAAATNSSASSSLHSASASSSAASPAPPSSFLWGGYRAPYPSLPPSPLPDFYSLSSWPADPLRAFVWWYGEAESYYRALAGGGGSAGWQAVSWPNNMQLATADDSGQPHVRNVLLKGVDERGLIFFTNRRGNKGRQLTANPKAAVVFYWKGLERQVRVEGAMYEVSDEQSDGYFHSRPVGSQVSAAVSPQSRPISSRAALEEHYVQQLRTVTAAAEDSSSSNRPMPASSVHIEQLPYSEPSTAAATAAGQSASAAHSHHQQALQALAAYEQQQRATGTDSGLQHCIARPSEWGGYRLIPRLFEFWEDGQYRLHSRVEYSRRGGTDKGSEEQHLSTAHSEWDKRFLAP